MHKKRKTGVHTSYRKPRKKCMMKMKQTKKKQCAHKMLLRKKVHMKNRWKQSLQTLCQRFWTQASCFLQHSYTCKCMIIKMNQPVLALQAPKTWAKFFYLKF